MRDFLRLSLKRLGYDIVRYEPARPARLPRDVTPEEARIHAAIRPYTLTPVARVVTLIRAVQYVVAGGLDGDFVECGVWRGGSMMAIAHTLVAMGATDRQLFLFDTYAGMPAPSEKDSRHDGRSAAGLIAGGVEETWVRTFATLEDVAANMATTGYSMENVHLVAGRVEDTLPERAPARICLLRLDTDWYESTRHELTQLYPRLVTHGILIIDDYGYWRGSRRATDEYFSGITPAPFLNRIDGSGRLIVKPSDGPGAGS
jgi:hypothetical protein